jgi:hypothetical protein
MGKNSLNRIIDLHFGIRPLGIGGNDRYDFFGVQICKIPNEKLRQVDEEGQGLPVWF